MNLSCIPKPIAYALGLRSADTDFDAAIAKINRGLVKTDRAIRDWKRACEDGSLDALTLQRAGLERERTRLLLRSDVTSLTSAEFERLVEVEVELDRIDYALASLSRSMLKAMRL